MEFASRRTARTYSDRTADASWLEWARRTLAPSGKDVVDIGCGGGIYTHAFAACGARSVIGIDRSAQYIDEAVASLPNSDTVMFRVGTAWHTTLPDACADIVFERALVHHLTEPEMTANADEAKRLLREDGMLVVQNRTIEDVESADVRYWIRATLLEAFPRLRGWERVRRPSRSRYSALLSRSGFTVVRELPFEEVRRTYTSFEQLSEEIHSRKGKSILFELSDTELERYCDILQEKAGALPLEEVDLWTVWVATT